MESTAAVNEDVARAREPGTRGLTSRPGRSRPRAGSRAAPALAFGPLAIPVAVHAVGAVQRRWMQEDGFINVRVAQQVLAGHGPVYNIGERVEAFTSPMWLGLLVVLRIITFGLVPYEWLAVGAGITLAVSGTIGLLVGCVTLWTPVGRRASDAWWLPGGVLVVVALSAVWDFSSAGLETGLGMAWIGWSFAVVARAAKAATVRDRARHASAGDQAAPSRPGAPESVPTAALASVSRVRVLPALVLVGLGPLVRPELALYSLSFVAVLVAYVWYPVRGERRAAPPWWSVALGFVAVPLGYQLFRMGYYAAMVPNTALAKNANQSAWSRGVDYLANTVGPYRLLLPAVLLTIGVVVALRDFPRHDQRAVTLAVMAPAVAHGLYVVWVGGDYMHGRLWVLPLVALVAPVAAVPLPRGWAQRAGRSGAVVRLAGVGLLVLWAGAAIVWLRPPNASGPLVDQRAVIVALARSDHPVTLDEQPAPFPRSARRWPIVAGPTSTWRPMRAVC